MSNILQLVGVGCFGTLVGWYVYYINRNRKGDIQLSDLGTLISILGGGAITALFESSTDLFGAYGIGLAIGFFGYFGVLIIFVSKSKEFGIEWFLDGRRKNPQDDYGYPPENERHIMMAK
jgi:hypothetical protein